jgi:hypothetical protein
VRYVQNPMNHCYPAWVTTIGIPYVDPLMGIDRLVTNVGNNHPPGSVGRLNEFDRMSQPVHPVPAAPRTKNCAFEIAKIYLSVCVFD